AVNREAERGFAEVKLRASIKIGELSRELEKAQGFAATILPNDRKNTKTEALKQAGIPISTANDYEQLTGGREEQAQKVGTNAASAFETCLYPGVGFRIAGRFAFGLAQRTVNEFDRDFCQGT